jgi:hypothetical protein
MGIQPGNRGQPPWQPGGPLVPWPTVAVVLVLVMFSLILWVVS